ncbi:MAG: C40 family peptidase [Rhodobacteraceae bacterium]|nr:C40 family peptidase [Paracoccaceae bacterium]
MTDRRLYPSNGRVAHESLAGIDDAEVFTEGEMKSVSVPVANLLGSVDGGLERQLLFGDAFLVLEEDSGNGLSFGQATDGGYVGYVEQNSLAPAISATHWVKTLGGHVYSVADFKSTPLLHLPFTARVAVRHDAGDFLELEPGGYIPKQQLAETNQVEPDFVTTAEKLLGTPYLWGGDSNSGLDCSGLVHICMRAAGKDCPRDSDLQGQFLGRPLEKNEPLKRGDLIFWQGHVGIMHSADKIVHANAYFMSVTLEKFVEVCERISAAQDGSCHYRRL